MSAEARRSWRPAFARWGCSSDADAAKAAATRRPTRLGFARIAESVVPDARVEAPAPLFELALKYVPRSQNARLAPNVRRRAVRAPPKGARSAGTRTAAPIERLLRPTTGTLTLSQKTRFLPNRIVPRRRKTKSASKKVKTEFYKVVRVRGDGRCMFRSLAIGLAHVTGRNLSSTDEETEADQLRLAVAESLCRSPEKRKKFDLATTAISFEMPIETYCKRILTPTFWGGEPELLVLAEILKRPITVYIPAAKARNAASQSGFVPIQTYGADFSVTKKGNKRKPVRLLYNGENHYDVLI